ncbi:unnamed protein product [Ixodes persulcatus]
MSRPVILGELLRDGDTNGVPPSTTRVYLRAADAVDDMRVNFTLRFLLPLRSVVIDTIFLIIAQKLSILHDTEMETIKCIQYRRPLLHCSEETAGRYAKGCPN